MLTDVVPVGMRCLHSIWEKAQCKACAAVAAYEATQLDCCISVTPCFGPALTPSSARRTVPGELVHSNCFCSVLAELHALQAC